MSVCLGSCFVLLISPAQSIEYLLLEFSLQIAFVYTLQLARLVAVKPYLKNIVGGKVHPNNLLCLFFQKCRTARDLLLKSFKNYQYFMWRNLYIFSFFYIFTFFWFLMNSKLLTRQIFQCIIINFHH